MFIHWVIDLTPRVWTSQKKKPGHVQFQIFVATREVVRTGNSVLWVMTVVMLRSRAHLARSFLYSST